MVSFAPSATVGWTTILNFHKLIEFDALHLVQFEISLGPSGVGIVSVMFLKCCKENEPGKNFKILPRMWFGVVVLAE